MWKGEKVKTLKTNVLDVKVKNYGECDWCKETAEPQTLRIPWAIWSQWLYLMDVMKGKEWGGVYWIRDNTITRWRLPLQEVTAASCEFQEDCGGDGMIHSHHSMGAYHSGQDDEQARNLYDYSIVLSSKSGIEYTATKRIILPCGGFGYCDVTIELIDMPTVDLKKIKEHKYSTTNYGMKRWNTKEQMWEQWNITTKQWELIDNFNSNDVIVKNETMQEEIDEAQKEKDWWEACVKCKKQDQCEQCEHYDNWKENADY